MAIKYLSGNRLQGTSAERLATIAIDTSATPTQDFDFLSQGSWDLNIEGSSSHWDLDSNRLNFETKGASSGSGAHFDLTSVPNSWILRFKVRIDSSQSGYTSAGQGDGIVVVGLQSHDTESGNTASSPNTSNQDTYSEAHDQAQLVLCYKTAQSEGSGKYSFQAKFANDSNCKQFHTYMSNNDIVDDTDYYVEIKQTTATSFELSYGTNSDYTTGRTTATATGVTLSSLRYIHVEGCDQNSSYSSYGGGYLDDMKYFTVASSPDFQTNAIFEESDTGKHYVFDGSSTWTEIS